MTFAGAISTSADVLAAGEFDVVAVEAAFPMTAGGTRKNASPRSISPPLGTRFGSVRETAPAAPPAGVLVVTMVEKIREPYQKHSRNISAVSDISVTTTAEPLKRDRNAEVRVILLCDSETERNCVFEAISKALADNESDIEDVQVLQ